MTNFYTLQAQQPNVQFGTPVFNNTPKAKAEQSLPIFKQAQAQNNPMIGGPVVSADQQQAFMQQDRDQMMMQKYYAKEEELGKIGVESLADNSISLMAQKLHDAGTPSEVESHPHINYIRYKNSKGEEAGIILTDLDGKPRQVTIEEGDKSHYFDDFNGDDIIDTAVTTTHTKGAQEKDATLILPNKAVWFLEDGNIFATTAYDGSSFLGAGRIVKEEKNDTAPKAEVEKEDIYTAPKAEKL